MCLTNTTFARGMHKQPPDGDDGAPLWGRGEGALCCNKANPETVYVGAFSYGAGTARAQRQLLRCLSREHPCKPPTYRSVHYPFKPHRGCRIQASMRLDKKYLVYQQGLYGAEFRTLGPVATGGGKLPTFRTAHAQRGHSAQYSP